MKPSSQKNKFKSVKVVEGNSKPTNQKWSEEVASFASRDVAMIIASDPSTILH